MNLLQRIVRHPASYLAISTLLVLLSMSVAAWLANRNFDADRELPLVTTLGSFAATLEGGTTSSRAMGAAILFGLENQEAKHAALGELPPDSPEVLHALDKIRTLYDFDTAFLLNKQRVIVTYSSKDNKSGTGKDVSFRPYAQLAMQGTPNVYPAIGITTNDRGIYLAAPLRAAMDNTTGEIGVVVVKIGVNKLDVLLKSWTSGIAVLLSPQGVVFATSRDDWLFRVAGEMSANRLADIQRTRQFGKVFDHTPPAALPFTLDEPETNIDGARYAVRSIPLEWNDPEGDWKLGLLERRDPWWTHWNVLGLAGLAGLIAAWAFIWLYTLARNAVLRQDMNEKLALTLNELESIMDTNPDILYVFNQKQELIKWNSNFEEFCGLAPEQMVNRAAAEFVCEEDRQMTIKGMTEVFKKGAASIEVRFVRHDGKPVPYLCNGMVLKNQNGEVIGFTGTGRNIADRHEREEAMRLAATVFNTVDEAVMVTSPYNLIVTVNPAFTAITGYSADEVIGKNPRILSAGKQPSAFYQEMWGTLAANGGWQGEVCNRRKNGELYVEWLSINVVRDENGKITNHVAVFSDISERKAAEEQLHHMAHYDVLTGLPNRTLFTDRVHQAVSQAKRDHARLALMFLDLDEFKPVNDTLGHNVGDMLLTEVARRLQDCVRESDTAARIGGDEFVVLLSHIETEHDAMRVAQKILHALGQSFELESHSLQISASVGVSIYPDHGTNEKLLSQCADTAMYYAKGSGRNNVKLYQFDMQSVNQ